MRAKNKKKLDYKHLNISGNYQCSSDEEQEEQEEKQDEKEEEQEKQDKKPIDLEKTIRMFDAHLNEEYFKNILNFKSLALCIKFFSIILI